MEKQDVESMANVMMGFLGFVTCNHCKSLLTSAVRCACGVALCAACWCGRCGACGAARDPRPDRVAQQQVKLAQNLFTTFESNFQYKMDEKVNAAKATTAHNVIGWLTHSNNQFIPLDTPQTDWNDIQVLPDTEDVKFTENNIGPMDLEPFQMEEEEESEPKIRRSSRKRGSNAEYPPTKKPYIKDARSTEKADNSSKWKNVKKMRKEFSKLSKIDKDKLNVSINMCKKAQNNKVSDNRASPSDLLGDKENDKNVHNDTETITLPDTEPYAGNITHTHSKTPDRSIANADIHQPGGCRVSPADIVNIKIPFYLRGNTHPETRRHKRLKSHIPFLLKGKLEPPKKDKRKLHLEVESRNGGAIDDVTVTKDSHNVFVTIGERHRKISIVIAGTQTTPAMLEPEQVRLTRRCSALTQTYPHHQRNTSSADTNTADALRGTAQQKQTTILAEKDSDNCKQSATLVEKRHNSSQHSDTLLQKSVDNSQHSDTLVEKDRNSNHHSDTLVDKSRNSTEIGDVVSRKLLERGKSSAAEWTAQATVLDSSFDLEEPFRDKDSDHRPQETLSEVLFTAASESAPAMVAEQPALSPGLDDADSVVEGTPQHDKSREVAPRCARPSPPPDTPLSQHFLSIQHHSTPSAPPSAPPARKSLSFQEPSLNATLSSQEKMFMKEAFGEREVVVSGSCLAAAGLAALRAECVRRGWRYEPHYCARLTHLVVAVDAHNRAQRSVKFMLSVACGKWVLSERWLEALRALPAAALPDEEAFEVLDMSGRAGPRAGRRGPPVLAGLTLYCAWELQGILPDTLQMLVTGAGGTLVSEPQRLQTARLPVVIADDSMHNHTGVLMVAMRYSAAPLGVTWLLDSIGEGRRAPARPALLCAEAAAPARLLDALDTPPV